MASKKDTEYCLGLILLVVDEDDCGAEATESASSTSLLDVSPPSIEELAYTTVLQFIFNVPLLFVVCFTMPTGKRTDSKTICLVDRLRRIPFIVHDSIVYRFNIISQSLNYKECV